LTTRGRDEEGEEKQEEAEWVTEDEWTDVERRRGGGRGLQQNLNKYINKQITYNKYTNVPDRLIS